MRCCFLDAPRGIPGKHSPRWPSRWESTGSGSKRREDTGSCLRRPWNRTFQVINSAVEVRQAWHSLPATTIIYANRAYVSVSVKARSRMLPIWSAPHMLPGTVNRHRWRWGRRQPGRSEGPSQVLCELHNTHAQTRHMHKLWWLMTSAENISPEIFFLDVSHQSDINCCYSWRSSDL